MADAPFDPTGAVTFDLAAGRVQVADAPLQVLVAADALAALAKAAGEDAVRDFGRVMGAGMGARMVKRLGAEQAPDKGMTTVTVECFVEHLAAEFAIAGLGAVSLERWGQALVLIVDHATLPASVTAPVLEGTLETATGRTVRCIKIMEAPPRMRFLVVGQTAAERVAQLTSEGLSWGEILVRIHVEQSAQARGDA